MTILVTGSAGYIGSHTVVALQPLLDLRGCIPSFIHVSDGKINDVNALDYLIPEPAAIYVKDRVPFGTDLLLCLSVQ